LTMDGLVLGLGHKFRQKILLICLGCGKK
jgi:hypothetical protein